MLASTSLCALAYISGCNGDAYNLGEHGAAGEEESACDVDVGSSGTLFVRRQADIDALRGCREIPGSLFIELPDGAVGASLAPLAELEVVRGVLSIDGPITSLAGLEALEQVSGLSLEGLLASDLTPLRSLSSLQRQPDFRRIGGAISIVGCDQLVDLQGLENLTVWESLHLESLPNLVSLAGLQVPSRADMIEITDAPQLSDVSALATVEEVTGLLLGGTAIESLDGLQLELADSLFVGGNPLLTDLDGLSQLRTLRILGIGGNPALRRAELPALDDFDSISIVDNAVLEAVPKYLASSGTFVQPAVGIDSFRFARRSFEVGGNPQLRTIVLPTDFSDIEHVSIYGNASLTSLDLGNLNRSRGLAIQDNLVLASVLAPTLERVADLAVRDNPALSVAPFANVQTFTREVAGNLDDLAP